jgi:hypothetical protein
MQRILGKLVAKINERPWKVAFKKYAKIYKSTNVTLVKEPAVLGNATHWKNHFLHRHKLCVSEFELTLGSKRSRDEKELRKATVLQRSNIWATLFLPHGLI